MEKSVVFEISWEVCNKVGGIYTVLVSKAAHMKRVFRENYFLIGPYFHNVKQTYFEERLAPSPIKQVFDSLMNEGIICHFGRWLVPSSPNVILVDFSGFSGNANGIKGRLYERFGIDSLGSKYFDYDEPMVWSTAVGRFIEAFQKSSKGVGIIAHCHEWLAAGAGLYLKDKQNPAKVVFTTHATMLGRTLAGNGEDFYNNLQNINPSETAYRLGMHTKHQTEVAIANAADVFTTVSEITGEEATQFLGRKPDIILPNGLDLKEFPTFEEISVKHKIFKHRLKEFVQYTLFPYYTFDLDNTIIMFTAARYEFRGKGLDVYIKALAKLDKLLSKSGKTVVNFFWVPTGNVHGIDPEILENKTFFEDIKQSIVTELPAIEEKLMFKIISNQSFSKNDLFFSSTLNDLKRKLNRFKKTGQPKLCSHLIDEAHDAIIQGFREAGLLNKKENAVKVFLYPIYLTGADGLLDLSYYECIQGAQYGVFPSFYEPWGYTPVEAAALGIISVTTDLSGFGRYIVSHFKDHSSRGVHVLPRDNHSDEEFVEVLAKKLFEFVNYSREERILNKMEAKKLSSEFDWERLVENYFKAYELAFSK